MQAGRRQDEKARAGEGESYRVMPSQRHCQHLLERPNAEVIADG